MYDALFIGGPADRKTRQVPHNYLDPYIFREFHPISWDLKVERSNPVDYEDCLYRILYIEEEKKNIVYRHEDISIGEALGRLSEAYLSQEPKKEAK